MFVFLNPDLCSAGGSKEHELSEWHEFLFFSVDSSDSCSFSYGWIRGLLELQGTRIVRMTRIFVYSVESDSCSFSYGWIRGRFTSWSYGRSG